MIAIPAEIITTGRELLTGRTVNTNASWIACQLTSKGVPVSRITSVDDRVVEISAAVSEALARRPSIIIITGGLGPTYDDLTSDG
ncbi:MAG TPA: molybdopterin-binding protein, partial [Candidatus Methanomethylicus sp.]|nr:molybdopterin-binding protein [Candidatus Methanomethylicus sp.]